MVGTAGQGALALSFMQATQHRARNYKAQVPTLLGNLWIGPIVACVLGAGNLRKFD